MAKVIKIIESKTEPGKNVIWLKREGGKPSLLSYSNGNWSSVSKESDNNEMENKISSIIDNLENTPAYSKKNNGGFIRGTYDTEVITPPCWMYINDNDSNEGGKDAWRLLTEEEIKPDGTFEIKLEDPIVNLVGLFLNKHDYVESAENYNKLSDGILSIDITDLNISKLKLFRFTDCPLLYTVITPNYFPLVGSLEQCFSNCPNLSYVTPFVTGKIISNANNFYYNNTTIVEDNLLSNFKIKILSNAYLNCSSLVKVPVFNLEYLEQSLTAVYRMFEGTKIEEVHLLNTEHIIGHTQMFRNCTNLKRIDCKFDGSTKMQSTFAGCSSLEEAPILNCANCINYSYTFYNCSSLKKVPYIDFTSTTNISNTFNGCSNLEFMEIHNLGASTSTSFNFSQCSKWGTGSDENRQSLIDSLITYSYDRASNNKSNATITLNAAVKALLTEEEKTAITTKGYTIA